MKAKWMVIAAVMMMVASFSAPSAQAGGTGLGILFSAGTDRNPIGGTVLFTSRNTGEVLTPNGRVVGVPEGDSVLVQITIDAAKSKDRNEVWWGINTLATDLSKAVFTSNAGWMFAVDAKDLFAVSDGGRPLHLAFVDRKGSQRFFRFFVKIPYGGKDDVTETATLFLKTIARTNDLAAQASSDASAAAEVRRANNKQIQDAINELRVEQARQGKFLASLSGSTAITDDPISNGITFRMKFIRKVSFRTVQITNPMGEVVDTRTVLGDETTYTLPVGDYGVAFSSTGSVYGPPVNFFVSEDMGPIWQVTVGGAK